MPMANFEARRQEHAIMCKHSDEYAIHSAKLMKRKLSLKQARRSHTAAQLSNKYCSPSSPDPPTPTTPHPAHPRACVVRGGGSARPWDKGGGGQGERGRGRRGSPRAGVGMRMGWSPMGEGVLDPRWEWNPWEPKGSHGRTLRPPSGAIK